MPLRSMAREAAASLGATLRRWGPAREGVAAVEFALVLPVMVFLYLGFTEVSFLWNTSRKVDQLARTVADLTGRAKIMNDADMNTILTASEAVMAPFKSAGLKVVVSSVVVKTTTNSSGQITSARGEVCWSRANAGATPLGKGSAVTVPAGYEGVSSFIWATVEQPYTPLFGSQLFQQITGKPAITLRYPIAWPVRDTEQVKWQGTNGC